MARLRPALEFPLFAFAYGLPLLPGAGNLSQPDDRALQLLEEGLLAPSILVGSIWSFGGLLLLVYLSFCLLRWIARETQTWIPVREGVWRAVVLLAGWFAMLAGNAQAFPHSNYTYTFAAAAVPSTLPLAGGLVLLLAFAAMARRIRASWTRARSAWAQRRVIGLGAKLSLLLVFGIVALALPMHLARSAAPVASQARNVILIGVDSLSLPKFEAERQELPTLNALAAQSIWHTRAYTSLGRTFPAWMSILSGQPAAEHRAVFNLRDLEGVDHQDLVTRSMQRRGYRTVYAIDERRFNNIDERFGFDQVVGPKVGALDFVLQDFFDTPLSNFALQTPLGRWLFPYSYQNVASHTNYDGLGFVANVGRAAAASEQPLFLAIHFLSGHFPFKTPYGVAVKNDPGSFEATQSVTLQAVDGQIRTLMARLKAEGRLENALVILLSDHGEGLGQSETLVGADRVARPFVAYGHGANLLSDRQNHIVLGHIEFQHGVPVHSPGERTELTSLLQIRQAIESYAAGGSGEIAAAGCFPVETGLRLQATRNYVGLNEAAVAREGAAYYEVSRSGLLQLRRDRLGELIATKDVGWRCANRLTIFTAATGDFQSFAFAAGGAGPFTEIETVVDDVKSIGQYRQRIASVVQ